MKSYVSKTTQVSALLLIPTTTQLQSTLCSKLKPKIEVMHQSGGALVQVVWPSTNTAVLPPASEAAAAGKDQSEDISHTYEADVDEQVRNISVSPV